MDLEQQSLRGGAQDNPLWYRKKIFFVQLINQFLKFKMVCISSLSFISTCILFINKYACSGVHA